MTATLATHETDKAAAETTGLGRLVRAVFGEWDRQGIVWAVLRNAEGLPDETRHDVDVLVAPANLKAAAEVVRRQARAQGWRGVATLDKFEYTCLCLAGPGPETRFVPIDLVAGLNTRCFPFADASAGLGQRARNAEGIWVVPQGFESATTLIKELLSRGLLKENSRASVRQGAESDAQHFRAALNGHLDAGLIEALERACQDGDWAQVERLAPAVRRKIFRLRPAHWPRLGRFLVHLARHYARPPLSCFVVLVGPDGSGKSSLADRLGEGLLQKPFKVVRRFKSTFNILPPLKQFKNGLRRALGWPVQAAPSAEPGLRHSGMIRPNPLWASMMYAAYYALDLCLGRLWLRRLRGQCALVVFDRYYHDYYYQLGNRHLPVWYLKLLEWLVPKPDLIIEIDRDAQDIYRQKPELTVEEIQREQRVIRHLLAGSAAARTIDARGGLAATSQAVEAAVLEWVLGGGREAPAEL